MFILQLTVAVIVVSEALRTMDCAVCAVRPTAAGNSWQHYYNTQTKTSKEQAWKDNLNKTTIYATFTLSSNYTRRPTTVSRVPPLSRASSCSPTPDSTSRPDGYSDSRLECCVRHAIRGSLWQLYDLIMSYLIDLFTINRKQAISITWAPALNVYQCNGISDYSH